MGNTVQASRIRNFDRSFILFGKGNSGKSTLANLLLGREKFQTHKRTDAFGLTRVVQSEEFTVDPRVIYGIECREMIPLNVQILDQPGCNDNSFKQENYCEFLKECIAKSKGEFSANFLIVISLTSQFFSPEEILTIMNIAEILSHSSYSFFPNASIVFTHADEVDKHLNKEKLEQELERILEQEDFAMIKDLIALVEGRCIFINGTNKSEGNRNEILRDLFTQSKPNLRIYINGNNGFKGRDIKQLLRINPDVTSFKNDSLKYDIEYHFNPDLNLFRRYERMDLGEEITLALSKLSGIGKGVSVMIILISLEEIFNNEMYRLILNLQETYMLDEDFKKDFWNYACILFKVPCEDENYLKMNLNSNQLLTDLVGRVKSRYISVSNETSKEVCSDKILSLVKRVKLETEGKTYIDGTVLAEMREIIKEAAKQRKCKGMRQMLDGIKNKELIQNGIPIFKLKNGPQIAVAVNEFFWSRKYISPRIGYFILKNLNQRAKAKEFKEKYSNQKLLSTEEFADFCLKALKEM